MGELYRFLLHLISGFFVVLFYIKLTQSRKNSLKLFIATLLYAIHMMISHTFMFEPFRSMIGVLILAIGIKKEEQKVNLAALLVPFLVFPIIRVITAIVVGAGVYILLSHYIDSILFQIFILLPIDILLLILLYRRIKLTKLIEAIREVEVKKIVYGSAALIWLAYGLMRILINSAFREMQILIISFFAFLILISIVMFIFVAYAVKQYTMKKKLEGTIIEKEQIMYTLEAQVEQVEKEKTEIELEKGKVDAERIGLQTTVHKYNKHISTLKTMTHRILKKSQKVDENLLSSLKNLNDASSELSEELVLDDFNATIDLLNFPKEWEYLETLLANFMVLASKDDITIKVISEIHDWSEIGISQIQIVGLVKNLLSNAIKETIKSNTDSKLIEIYFLQDDFGIITIEVTDHAHEFPIEILKKLGERGNSSNATGDGYAEIFEILNATDSSLHIKELKFENYHNKRILIRLDGMNEKLITSNYRFKELNNAIYVPPIDMQGQDRLTVFLEI